MAAKKRIQYIDTIKAVAILAVIFIHVSLLWLGKSVWGVSFDSIAEIGRFAVPLFLMVSGALLLNREYELSSFFKRRISRIVYPYILWIIPLLIFVFAIKSFRFPNQSWLWLFSHYFFGRWYFWMILGIYCTIPVINEFIKSKGMEGVEYFLIIAIIASLFYQFCKAIGLVTYLDLRFFVGPLTYMMLGYYVNNKEFDMPANKILTISLLIFIVTTGLKMGFDVIGYGYTHLNFNNPVILLESNLDVNILGYLRAAALFVFIKYLYSENLNCVYSSVKKVLEFNPVRRFILSVAKASYGIYLVHDLFLNYLMVFILPTLLLPEESLFGLIFILTPAFLIISWLIVIVVNRIPGLSKWSGYE